MRSRRCVDEGCVDEGYGSRSGDGCSRDHAPQGHARVNAKAKRRRRDTAAKGRAPEGSDHRTIVGAVSRRRDAHLDASLCAPQRRKIPQLGVGAKASPNHEGPGVVIDACTQGFGNEHIRHCCRKGGCDICRRDRVAGILAGFDPSSDGRLEATEGEIVGVFGLIFRRGQRAGKHHGRRIPFASEAIDVRPTGIRETQQTTHLVEGLSCSVVKRVAKLPHIGGDVVDEEQRRVSTGDHKSHEALREGAMHKFVHRDMTHDVVYPVERPLKAYREGLRRSNTHREGANEAGARGHSDGVDVCERRVGMGERSLQRGEHLFQMRAGCHLGNNPPEACMLIHGTCHGFAEERRSTDEGNARLIAGALDAKD